MNILVVGAGTYPKYMAKFGHVITYDSSLHYDIPVVDLIVFTGGADVSPLLYGEKAHFRTTSNGIRDHTEAFIVKQAFARGIPCVGICRGGQFLSVMNGDSLVQDVTHHYQPHDVVYENKMYRVTSTHHQMMIGARGEVIAWTSDLSNHFEGGNGRIIHMEDKKEPEVVWYDVTSCLCVQFHPEHTYNHQGSKLFFKLMEEYIL